MVPSGPSGPPIRADLLWDPEGGTEGTIRPPTGSRPVPAVPSHTGTRPSGRAPPTGQSRTTLRDYLTGTRHVPLRPEGAIWRAIVTLEQASLALSHKQT